jgi:hypothetical protein
MVLFIFQSAFSLESKILKKISKYMPDFTEQAMIANVVNLYVQVSGFVRETNKMVGNIKQAKAEWENLKVMIEELYYDVEGLRNIDPYDMDTWAITLENANNLLLYDLTDVVHRFNMVEYYTLDASMEYWDNLDDLSNYDVRVRKNKEFVQDLYYDDGYTQSIEELNNINMEYMQNTLDFHRKQVEQAALLMEASTSKKSKKYYREYMERHLERIEEVEREVQNSSVGSSKLDSILTICSDLIAVNLTEIQNTMHLLQRLENASANLVDAWYKLKEGNVNTLAKLDLSVTTEFIMDLSEYDPSDPDKVAAPSAPKNQSVRTTRRKKVSEQDILSLQNAGEYLSLRQESIIRDTESMKSSTLAMIVMLEAYRQDARERENLRVAHQAKIMEMGFANEK